MRSIPNITCFTPTTKSDLLDVLEETYKFKSPTYTRFQKLKEFQFKDKSTPSSIPTLRIKGSSIAVITYGSITKTVEEAISKNTENKPSLYTINKIDQEEWFELKNYSKLVIIEEHVQNGSLVECALNLKPFQK